MRLKQKSFDKQVMFTLNKTTKKLLFFTIYLYQIKSVSPSSFLQKVCEGKMEVL